MHKRIWLILLAAAALLLCGCGASVSASPPEGGPVLKENAEPVETAEPGPAGPVYEAPPFLDAEYHLEPVTEEGTAQIDISALSEGYVAVSAASASRLKFQIRCGDETYTYDLHSDGTPSVFPLSCGDGEYDFRVMENVVDNRYAEIASELRGVEMNDEFQPYLRPSDYISYGTGSACVKKAAELAAQAHSETEVVGAVYEFLCAEIDYDNEKAATVQTGYVPDPDEILQSRRGICFDYAALAAAMLRSQGIPTKMIFGYVSPDGLYHAWNMFYTDETGWVTVGFATKPGEWTRMDATFAAGGADAAFVGDGSNYSDLYCY